MSDQEPLRKTADRTAYMREYKQKKYAENPTHIKEKNKAYYYKTKCGLDTSFMKKYDTLLPYVARIHSSIIDFKARNRNLAIEYLTELLEELVKEDLREIEITKTLPEQEQQPENIVMHIQVDL